MTRPAALLRRQVPISKNGACPNMECSRCRKGFRWCAQRTTRNLQRATHNTQHAACNVHHTPLQSRARCGAHEPSCRADVVAAVGPVPVQMWAGVGPFLRHGRAQRRRHRCCMTLSSTSCVCHQPGGSERWRTERAGALRGNEQRTAQARPPRGCHAVHTPRPPTRVVAWGSPADGCVRGSCRASPRSARTTSWRAPSSASSTTLCRSGRDSLNP